MNTSIFALDECTPFQIRRIEELEPGSAIYNNSFRRQSGFEILWITEGEGELEMDILHYPLTSNSFLLMSPGHVRRVLTSSMMDGYYISLSPDFLCRIKGWAETPLFDPAGGDRRAPYWMNLDKEIAREMEALIKIVMNEFERRDAVRRDLLYAYVGVLLLYVSMLFEFEPSVDSLGREREIVGRFMDLVKTQFAHKKMVSDYAAELYISPNYLNQVVKRITGFTASYHIHQRVILEAKRRAVSPGFKLKEIAYALGFEDSGHFSKFFKRKCGMTYTRFRREAAV